MCLTTIAFSSDWEPPASVELSAHAWVFLSNTLTFVCIRFQDWRHHINTAGNKISAIYKVTFCLSNIDTLLRNRVWPK